MPIRDGALATRARRVFDDGADGLSPVNAEHPEQRAALIAALGRLPTYAASGKAAVTGTVTPANLATAPIVGPFTPIAGRPFNITADGGVGVAAQIERSFDGGATWFVKYRAADLAALPPTFSDTESELGVQYRVVVTAITGGTVTIRLSQ